MALIRRLPKYHRYLAELLEKGVAIISSKELSKVMGFTASQIRQDFNTFGEFGQQGYGYNVEVLYREIGRIIGLDQTYRTVIVGAGHLGQAIANYTSLKESKFIPQAMFDINPRMFGIKIGDIEIKDVDELENFVRNHQIDIGIICTPGSNAQEVADRLVKANIKGIWNFAPIDLKIPEQVVLENVHVSESLFALSFLMKNNK
ncbi:redox-sensing transcriptional repressor Rex [Anaerosolibacter carboniphilus]|nr:redox-sensing transcriptional repressor Rex [Anaerosolibacter carboniphilus]